MISSKPADAFLDHDHLEDIHGNIYVVIGNVHPPSKVIAYLKYVPVSGRTIWCRGNVCYERVIKKYGVRNVMSTIKHYQEYSYDPVFGTKTPQVSLNKITNVYKPNERLWEIMRKPRDDLELEVIDLVDEIERYIGIKVNNVGIDGSILAGIHNPKYSDIDLIIYGCRESIYFTECLSNIKSLGSLPSNRALKHLLSQSEIYGLSVDLIKNIQPPYKRLWFRGRREVNVAFVDRYTYRYGDVVFKPLTPVEIIINIEGGSCTSLFYPSYTYVNEVKDVRGVSNPDLVREIKNRLIYVISYEGIFSYVLYKGGELLVRGLLELVLPQSYYVVIVGAIENPGYVIPLRHQ